MYIFLLAKLQVTRTPQPKLYTQKLYIFSLFLFDASKTSKLLLKKMKNIKYKIDIKDVKDI